jgi:hypothetical protein
MDADDPADFYIPLDCDEFLSVERDGRVDCSRGALEEELSSYVKCPNPLVILAGLDNHPHKAGFFRWAHKQRKTFFAEGACAFLDHGFHVGRSRLNLDPIRTKIVYIHYHFKPYDLLIEHAKQKLEYFTTDFNENSMKKYIDDKKPAWHCAQHILRSREEYSNMFADLRFIEFPEITRQFELLGQRLPFSSTVSGSGASESIPCGNQRVATLDSSMSSLQADQFTNYGILRTQDTVPIDTGTVMVVGVPRSGTSMVAAVLKALGVYIGDEIDNAVFEDREFAAALAAENSGRLHQLISARNDQHRFWGFKRPEAYRHLDQLCRSCRNPRVIVTFRDILAISLRNNISMQMDPLKLLPRLAEEYRELVATISGLSVPSLLLSYEKSLQFPTETVKEIVSFCNLEATPQQINAAALVIENGTPAYVNGARLKYQGSIGRLIDGRLRGWAKVIHSDNIRVNVELQLDGVVAQRAWADMYRSDVHKAGFGDGRYGFEFVIDDDISGEAIVSVRIQNSRILLRNSGLSLSSYSSTV